MSVPVDSQGHVNIRVRVDKSSPYGQVPISVYRKCDLSTGHIVLLTSYWHDMFLWTGHQVMFTCQFLLTANVMLTYECVLTRASPVDKCLFLYTGSVAYVQVTFSCQHHVVTLKRCMSCQFVMLTRYVSVNRTTSPFDRWPSLLTGHHHVKMACILLMHLEPEARRSQIVQYLADAAGSRNLVIGVVSIKT